MRAPGATIVDVVRDFLAAHRALRSMLARFRAGEPCFAEAALLVGESDASLLFRLKERCHAVLRPDAHGAAIRRGILVDLAVGSLYHEAVKFRENLYQQEVYAPRIRRLAEASASDARESERADQAGASGPLLEEFERILLASQDRLQEALEETDALLDLTRAQIRLMLDEQRGDGLLARFLCEHPELVDQTYPEGHEALLRDIYGDVAAAFMLGARSYLESAYFAEAVVLLREVLRRDPGNEHATRLTHFADGMQAFLAGHYPRSVDELSRWLDGIPHSWERRHAELARAALARLGNLVEGADRRRLLERAEHIADQIGRLLGETCTGDPMTGMSQTTVAPSAPRSRK